MNLPILDIVCLIFLIVAAFKGFKNGFIKEVAFLLILILGVYISYNFSYITFDFISGYVDWNKDFLVVLSYVITFFTVAIAISLLSKVITSLTKLVFLGSLNSILGSVFGILKILVILSILFAIYDRINQFTEWSNQKKLDKSIAYKTLKYINTELIPIKKGFDIDDIKNSWEENRVNPGGKSKKNKIK